MTEPIVVSDLTIEYHDSTIGGESYSLTTPVTREHARYILAAASAALAGLPLSGVQPSSQGWTVAREGTRKGLFCLNCTARELPAGRRKFCSDECRRAYHAKGLADAEPEAENPAEEGS
jgi:hypothetical protein